MSLLGFGVRVTLASYYELGNSLPSFIFWKRLCMMILSLSQMFSRICERKPAGPGSFLTTSYISLTDMRQFRLVSFLSEF